MTFYCINYNILQGTDWRKIFSEAYEGILVPEQFIQASSASFGETTPT